MRRFQVFLGLYHFLMPERRVYPARVLLDEIASIYQPSPLLQEVARENVEGHVQLSQNQGSSPALKAKKCKY